MKPETIEATYRIVTPMFCGGVDNTSAEFRLPSFKGALRFWWRALAWQRLGGDPDKIHKEEAELFGSSDEGQAKFLLRVVDPPEEVIEKGEILRVSGKPTKNGKKVGPGARYLGYGVMEAFRSRKKGHKAGELTRSCLAVDQDFTVQITFKPGDFGKYVEEMKDALLMLSLFGGLGSRSQNGYGSIWLREITGLGRIEGWDGFTLCFERLLGKWHGTPFPDGLPEYSAISRHTLSQVFIGDKWTWAKALDVAGAFYKYFVEEKAGTFPGGCSKRIGFGLPRHYRKGTKPMHQKKRLNRRASSLHIKILPLSDKEPAITFLHMPAKMLPNNSKIKVGHRSYPVPDNPWKGVEAFFESLDELTEDAEEFLVPLPIAKNSSAK